MWPKLPRKLLQNVHTLGLRTVVPPRPLAVHPREIILTRSEQLSPAPVQITALDSGSEEGRQGLCLGGPFTVGEEARMPASAHEHLRIKS